jgi:hypothetical protein
MMRAVRSGSAAKIGTLGYQRVPGAASMLVARMV